MKRIIKSLFLRFAPRKVLHWSKKWHYAHALRNFNEGDEKDLLITRMLVRGGETAIDIGANVGIYTKILSEQVGQKGHVYSIEPVPPTFSLLSHCAKKLGLSNVILLNIGISDSNRSVSMVVPAYEQGGENFHRAHIVGGAGLAEAKSTFNVSVKTLDSVLEDNRDAVTFIKCDVEGHELPVINGARRTIERTSPAILIEISDSPDESGSDAEKVFSYLNSNNYTPYWFDGIELRKRAVGDSCVNYFFLNTGHLQRVKSAGIQVVE